MSDASKSDVETSNPEMEASKEASKEISNDTSKEKQKEKWVPPPMSDVELQILSVLALTTQQNPMKTLEIARAIFGQGAQRKSINSDIYRLASRKKVTKISEEDGTNPRWYLTPQVQSQPQYQPQHQPQYQQQPTQYPQPYSQPYPQSQQPPGGKMVLKINQPQQFQPQQFQPQQFQPQQFQPQHHQQQVQSFQPQQFQQQQFQVHTVQSIQQMQQTQSQPSKPTFVLSTPTTPLMPPPAASFMSEAELRHMNDRNNRNIVS